MLLVVGDVLIDNEVPVVTLSILRFVGLTWFFESTYRDRCVCVRVFIGISLCPI